MYRTYPEFVDGLVDVIKTADSTDSDVNGLELSLHLSNLPAQQLRVVKEKMYTVITLYTSLVRYEGPAWETLITLLSSNTGQTLTSTRVRVTRGRSLKLTVTFYKLNKQLTTDSKFTLY